MQGELTLLRQSFQKYILITLPFLSNQHTLKSKASELCQILRDTQKTIVEVYRIVQKLQPKQDSPSPTHSYHYSPFGCLSRDSQQSKIPQKPENIYYMRPNDKIIKEPVKVNSTSVNQPALKLSPEKRLKIQHTEYSNLQTTLNTHQDIAATNAKTTHKAQQSLVDFNTNKQAKKTQGMTEIMKGLSNLKYMMSQNGLATRREQVSLGDTSTLTAQKSLNIIKHVGQITFNESTPRNKKLVQKKEDTNLSERKQESIHQSQPQYVSPLEQYMEKQSKTHFEGKNSLLRSVQHAFTEFQRNQLTLGTVYKLTSDTKESWFHDSAASPSRQSPLKRNLIFAKMDDTMIDRPIEDQDTPRNLFYLEKI